MYQLQFLDVFVGIVFSNNVLLICHVLEGRLCSYYPGDSTMGEFAWLLECVRDFSKGNERIFMIFFL